MAQIRKWVMVPADFEQSDALGISRDDIELIIQFAKSGKVDGKGCLLDKDGSSAGDSHIAECLLKKNACQYFGRFLELKAQVPEKGEVVGKTKKKTPTPKPAVPTTLSTPRSPPPPPPPSPPVTRSSKGNKRKKSIKAPAAKKQRTDWEWDDD